MLKEILGGPKWAPEPQDALQGRPGCPKGRQADPKGGLRAATLPPRWAKIAQGGAQDEPKVAKEISKMRNGKC